MRPGSASRPTARSSRARSRSGRASSTARSTRRSAAPGGRSARSRWRPRPSASPSCGAATPTRPRGGSRATSSLPMRRSGTSPCSTASVLHGALHVPSDGIARGINICQALQEAAEARGATFVGRTRATGIDMAGGRVRAVETDQGAIRTSTALVCLRPLGAGVHARARPAAGGDAADAAPLRLDRSAARAGRRERHRSPDPAPSGSRHVLPPARRGLRHRRLRARADHDRAGRAGAPPRRPPDRHGPVLRGALARVARLGAGAAAPARTGRHRRDVQRALLVRSRQQLVRGPDVAGRRASGSPTASGSRTPAAPPRPSST